MSRRSVSGFSSAVRYDDGNPRTRAAQSDAEFFKANPDAIDRVRGAIPGELTGSEHVAAFFTDGSEIETVHVIEIEPGIRIRVPISFNPVTNYSVIACDIRRLWKLSEGSSLSFPEMISAYFSGGER
jgi:hypothetical protein